MAIVFEHGIDLPQSPHQVFTLLDDFSKTPLWLERCEGVVKHGTGPHAAGDKLRYAYKEGGHHGVMDGVIVAYEPDAHLSYHYRDTLMAVAVDFRLTMQGEGTHLLHRIEIAPQSFIAKLMAPLIRSKLPKQTITAMENLRRLLAREMVAA